MGIVENILKNSGELMTVAELKRKLPKKGTHQKLLNVLGQLQADGKLIIGAKGVLWVSAERGDRQIN